MIIKANEMRNKYEYRNSNSDHPWSINPWKKPIEHYTIEELCVYLADYTASRRDVDIDYKGNVSR